MSFPNWILSPTWNCCNDPNVAEIVINFNLVESFALVPAAAPDDISTIVATMGSGATHVVFASDTIDQASIVFHMLLAKLDSHYIASTDGADRQDQITLTLVRSEEDSTLEEEMQAYMRDHPPKIRPRDLFPE